jgi:pullulanase-type alpha-1,6-glucosidase
VTIAGTLQSELGCPGDWMPDCNKTNLTLDPNDGIWKGIFDVTPNNDQDQKGPRYKVALDGSWSVNYGKNAVSSGADIPLVVDKATKVKFYFDPISHWVTDNFNTPIVVATGDFQKQLGCSSDNDLTCMRAWLEDPSGSGTYSFTTHSLKAGIYTLALAINDELSKPSESAQPFTVANDGDEIYFGYDAVKKALTISTTGAPIGDLTKSKAVWVNQDTILWNIAGSPLDKYSLVSSPDASLSLTPTGITGGKEIQLSFSQSGPGGDVFTKNPYLSTWSAFKIDATDFAGLPEVVKGQLAVVARNDQGKLIDATGVQLAGALDSLFSYSGPLGVTFVGDVPTLGVWAPTARSVKLHLFSDSTTKISQVIPMTADPKTGVWSVAGQPDWKGQFYLFEVQVYVPTTGKIETNLVTDPYSFSLSTNSLRSQIVDLNETTLKPQGWDTLPKPALAAPEDSVIYEMQVRDFSISDQTVPEALRGTFKAFTVTNSDGMTHLAALAKAGLTHIHLLPAFDFASINEDKSTWKTVDSSKLVALPPDSSQQSAAVALIQSQDGFNWGYDPYHYTVPEGSYATDPNGTPRILEFRQMVAALNQIGLRVVMDVVYNHTAESGQNPKSVLDKIVPGYYYRLNTEGAVETATCCQDTATEHTMMRKLMVDSVVTWAKQYKVDGFRFDLMGFHMLSDMQAVRAALDALTLEQDGVDGKSIYIYGEGWDFGEVANGARGINATQLNIGGTGIGVFNDRLRDGVRGGSPFTDPREQGFSTGLFLDPNAADILQPAAQKNKLLAFTDWIRLGLAGNLSDYMMVSASGNLVDGAHIDYNGSQAGYTLDPQENIVYVSAHDNQTIFDAVQTKAPASASLTERIRMNNLALSIPMFSQGIPFFHAGDDILRSKSLDDNSYDSGDWFNKLDWTLTSNNWGVGLSPNAGSNKSIFAPLLADPKLKPDKSEITNAGAVFQEFLEIRKNSLLFRLQTAEEVSKALTFLNTGPDQVPGLIVMVLTDPANLDPNYASLVVLFNANPNGLKFSDPSFKDKLYTLHPVLQNSADPVARTAAYDSAKGSFTVPGYTTSVFTLKKVPQPPAASVSIPLMLGIVVGIVAALAFFIWRRSKN